MTKKEMTKKLSSYSGYYEQINWLSSAIDSQKAALKDLERRKKDLLEKSERLQNIIMGVEDPLLRDVLIRRFTVGQTFGEIAEELCYSVRHIARLSALALEEACAAYTQQREGKT